MPRIRLPGLALPVAVLAHVLAAQFRALSPALAQRVTCASFPNQAAAQSAYRRDPVGLTHLDADRDGIACESLRGTCDKVPVVLPQPAPAPAAGRPCWETAHDRVLSLSGASLSSQSWGTPWVPLCAAGGADAAPPIGARSLRLPSPGHRSPSPRPSASALAERSSNVDLSLAG
jgi:hypothetical protein